MQQNTPPYDARAVANFLLDLAAEKKVAITQLVLLKLLYFSHGWYLSYRGNPLVKQEFEAWRYGPVVKVVRDEFKRFGDTPITARAFMLNIFSGQRLYAAPELAQMDSEFVRQIFRSYYFYDAWDLSDMTHEEGSPWDNLWNAEHPIGRLGLRIKNEEIKAHFDGLSRRVRLA